WPDVKDFLVKYIAGPTPIPYEEYFALAGFRFTPRTERKAFSLGGFTPGVSEKGVFFIQPGSSLNEFGKALGYREGDEIYAFNGARITPQNFGHIVDSLRRNMKEGDLVQVLAGRMNATGGRDTITLSAKAFPVTTVDLNRIEPMPFPTRRQEAVRTAWLTTRRIDPVEHRVDSADVRSIESIIPALYDVISGPAGSRDWERFHALFLPGATMGASTTLPGNVPGFRSMTTMEYQQANTPHFNSSGFFEEEIGRRVSRYGNIAMVESAYQFRMTPGGPVQQRGVNYITLAFARNRWWIVNISWQPESTQFRIPEALLDKK
ncbi:MAG TPA: hypothetical protein VFZ78_07345, partial [Flavisolibacter sp.]